MIGLGFHFYAGALNRLIKDFRAAKVDWQLEMYSGAEHGCSMPKNTAEERANALFQASVAKFLSDVFGH